MPRDANEPRGRPRAIWRENLAQAVRVMRMHRMRSVLVILGVTIGVTTILMMVTALDGLARKINRDMVSASRPYVYAQKYDLFVSGEEERRQRRRPELTPEDAEAMLELCPGALRSTFMVQSSNNYIVRANGEHTTPMPLFGASTSFPEIYTFNIERGRYYTDSEVERRERVVVLGYGPAHDLFPDVDPIGRTIRVAGHRYRVVGTLASRHHIFGSLSDNFVVMPHTTYEKDVQTEFDFTSLAVTARDGVSIDDLAEQVTVALRIRRGLRPNEENNFVVLTSESFLDLVRRITVPIGIVLTVLASIGLVVGGIGVMNIMLISVTERTREIGVRMALGARKSYIVQQFLVEAGTLTGLGGVLGTVFGTLAAWGVSRVIHFPFSVSVFWTVTSVLFSVFVGVVFGLYPARRAASLDPVEALRYE